MGQVTTEKGISCERATNGLGYWRLFSVCLEPGFGGLISCSEGCASCFRREQYCISLDSREEASLKDPILNYW